MKLNMYEYYSKGSYDIMHYSFNTVAEFLDYIERTPTNNKIWGRRSLVSMSGSYSFCRTNSLEEAMELLKYGDRTDFDKLMAIKRTLDDHITLSPKPTRQFYDYVGYAPCVPAYLSGNPLNMFNRVEPQRKHFEIYFNAAILGRVGSEEIFNRGTIVLSLVEILEKLGFTVGLNVFTMSSECIDNNRRQIHYAEFKLKKPNERLNSNKLFFPLCNPSMLRRLVFRLREETPDILYPWTTSYGSTSDANEIRNVLSLSPEDIIICQPRDMGIQGYDIYEDANAVFDYLEKGGYTDNEFTLRRVRK